MPRNAAPTGVRGKARKPSREERALWRAAMKDASELPRRPQHAEAEEFEEEPAASAAPAAAATDEAKPAAASAKKPSQPRGAPPELAAGATAGLDKRSALRLKRGQYPIEAKLDLHGMTEGEAHGVLVSFLRAAYERERRCVLVVTGKGRGGEGILRRALPRWLNAPELRPLVLAFAQAQAKHGGAGAFYLLLKRRR